MSSDNSGLDLLFTAIAETDRGDEPTLTVFGRTPDGKRRHVVLYGFENSFYAPADEVDGHEIEVLNMGGVADVTDEYAESLKGHNTRKIVVRTSRDIGSVREQFTTTYNSDIVFRNQFLIDSDVKSWIHVPEEAMDGATNPVVHHEDIQPIPEADAPEPPEIRVCTLDIETDDRGAFPESGERRILSIVAHDSFSDETFGFIDLDGTPVTEKFPGGRPEELDGLHYQPDEKAMLKEFLTWFSKHDFDMITGWNVEDFDMKFLINRMNKIGVSPSKLSPVGSAFIAYRGDPVIQGVEIYDLMAAYKANQFTEKGSYRLDAVALDELGEGKLDYGNVGVWDLYTDDPDTLMNYNARDVRLCVELDAECGVIEFRDNLRHMVGVQYDDTIDASDFIVMMLRRELLRREMVVEKADYSRENADYEGAHVFDAFNGVATNVVGIDLKSLYPMTMKMLNASPDVKIDGEPAPGSRVITAPNGVMFDADKQGVFTALVDKALEFKKEYKQKVKNATTQEEHKKWESKYNSAKTIVNSLYGVIGWSKFPAYDPEVAHAVTAAGQAAVKAAAEYVESLPTFSVVYGDTDSVYIQCPEAWGHEECLEAAEDIATHLNDVAFPKVAAEMGVRPEDCLWEIEVESFMERFLQWGEKKLYAYLPRVVDGVYLDDPDIVVKGSKSKRSDSAPLTKDLEKNVLKGVLHGYDPVTVGEFVYEAARSIDPDEPDWEYIGVPGGISKEFHEYDKPTVQVRGATYANKYLGTNYRGGSKPRRVYLRDTYLDGEEIDVICFEEESDLAPRVDELTVDVPRMTDLLVRNVTIEKILGAYNVSMDAAISGQQQTGLNAWV